MITPDQLKEIQERTQALNHYLDIPRKQMEYEEEQLRTQAPDFWEDAKRAEDQMKKVKSLEKWIKGYAEVRTLADELATAFDFYKEELVTEQEVDDIYARTVSAIEDLELKNMLRQEEDPMDAVLKINSGAGGTEAQDWAQMLMRMYMRWAEQNGYKCVVSNLLEADDAGIKSCTLEIMGEYAYGYLKGENGVHRLVRVSPYNAQGKRMTSFASVFVTPLVDDSIEVNIEQARISWDTFRSSGAGGQNVNRSTPALSVQRPLHRRGRGNSHREHRDARPAQEQGKRTPTPPLHALRQGTPTPHGRASQGRSRKEENRMGITNTILRLRRPTRQGPPDRLPDFRRRSRHGRQN